MATHVTRTLFFRRSWPNPRDSVPPAITELVGFAVKRKRSCSLFKKNDPNPTVDAMLPVTPSTYATIFTHDHASRMLVR